jgi:hypothetical protein
MAPPLHTVSIDMETTSREKQRLFLRPSLLIEAKANGLCVRVTPDGYDRVLGKLFIVRPIADRQRTGQ